VPALSPGLDLTRPLAETVELGASLVPGALTEQFTTLLMRELQTVQFEQLQPQVGPHAVRQQGEVFIAREHDLASYPAVRRLRADLVRLVRAHARHLGDLERWYPNEATVQRYRRGDLGISPHRDGTRYRTLIAIFTVAGSAPFALCSDRAGTVLREWMTTPRSLVLMRGTTGAAEGTDSGAVQPGPLHTARGPVGRRRVSLSFREAACR
jgi:alkylated DNA repair dioxygenase AlkB